MGTLDDSLASLDGDRSVDLEELTTEEIGITERSQQPSGKNGKRILYAKDSDGNIYKVNPDGSEAQVGGAGDLGSLSDVYKQSTEPTSPNDGDVWVDTS